MALEKIIEKPQAGLAAGKPEKLEQSSRPELKVERLDPKPEKNPEVLAVGEKVKEDQAAGQVSAAQSYQKKRAAAIDSILSENLNEIFLQMNAKQQKEFKEKGEETVLKINLLLSGTKIKVNKIISLIKEWLKLIPGINKFFLEQEAKIKADKILKIKDKF